MKNIVKDTRNVVNRILDEILQDFAGQMPPNNVTEPHLLFFRCAHNM